MSVCVLQVRSIHEWQLSVNQHFNTSKQSMEISGLNQIVFPVDSSTWVASAAETCQQKYLPEFPDSGFHSCLTDQNCLNESKGSEENLEEANESSLGNSLETVKPCEGSVSGPPSDEEAQLSHGEYSKESSISEQDSILLQQYLKSVEQLDDADDKTSCRGDTETRPLEAGSSENQAALCNAVSGCQDVLRSVQDRICHAPEQNSLNAEVAEGKSTDSDASFQALAVSIIV